MSFKDNLGIPKSEILLAQYTTNTTQSASGTTVLNFGNKVKDTHGLVVTTSPWQMKVNMAGFYLVNVGIQYNASMAGGETHEVYVYKNGVNLWTLVSHRFETARNDTFGYTGSTMCELLENDVLSIVLFSSAGGTIQANTGSNGTYVHVTLITPK